MIFFQYFFVYFRYLNKTKNSIIMLKYIKVILEKVSFDKILFEKELRKGVKELLPNEIKDLQLWCYDRFGQVYFKVLNNVFGRAAVA